MIPSVCCATTWLNCFSLFYSFERWVFNTTERVRKIMVKNLWIKRKFYVKFELQIKSLIITLCFFKFLSYINVYSFVPDQVFTIAHLLSPPFLPSKVPWCLLAPSCGKALNGRMCPLIKLSWVSADQSGHFFCQTWLITSFWLLNFP